MWSFIHTGRRSEDVWFAVDLAGGRVCAHCDTEFVAGNQIEPLTRDHHLKKVGVVLWSKAWPERIILKRHAGWTPEEYFEHANRIFNTNPAA